MTTLRFATSVFLLLPCSPSLAAVSCTPGFQPRGDICISQAMTDYIACIDASGGNKEKIYQRIAYSINKGGRGKVAGTASGVVIKGKGDVSIDNNTKTILENLLSKSFHGGGMETCRKTLNDIRISPILPVTLPPPPQVATATFKVCVGEREDHCKPHDRKLDCYADVDAWAQPLCSSHTKVRYDNYGGNHCGYDMFLVTCIGPR